jgi:NNP family nitrate/nitrite transporter-like MFS transporter
MSETVDRRGARTQLALATLAFTVCFSSWAMIAPIATKLEDKYDLSNTQTALMVAIPVVLGSLLRIPLGALTDRLGGRRVFSAILVYAIFPPLLLGFADSYAMLLVAGFFLGVAGAAFAIGVPFVADWFNAERQGFAVGVYGVGTAGTAIAVFAMPAMVKHWGRPTAGLVISGVLAAMAIAWIAFARTAPGVHHEPARYRRVLRSGWKMWRLAFFYFVTFGGFVAMTIYLPKLLKDWFAYSLSGAAFRTAGFVIIAAVIARPLGGALADRHGGPKVLSVAFIGIGIDAIGLSWQASDPSIVPVTIFCLTMAGFLGLGNGAVFKMVPHYFPTTKGAVTGIVGAAGGLGGFFPPLVMGIVKDATGDYVMGFVFLVAFAWVCAGQALSLREPRQPDVPTPTPHLTLMPGDSGLSGSPDLRAGVR